MDEPAIKGSAFQSVVADLKRLVDDGVVDLEDCGLTAKDRGFLDRVITPVSWMPMGTYARLLEVLAREEGGTDPRRYLRRRGYRAAERLLGGTYEGFQAEPGSWSRKTAESFLGIARMLYNFTRWSAVTDAGDHLEFHVEEAAGYPDAALYSAEGFLTFFAECASGREVRVESERTSPDRVVLRVFA